MRKILPLIAILVCGLYMNDANAIKETDEIITTDCLEGLFCTTGGKYQFTRKTISDWFNGTDTVDVDNITKYTMEPAFLLVDGWGEWSDEGLCDTKFSNRCIYAATDYDQIWVSMNYGFYTVKNGQVVYHSSGNSVKAGVFPCPATHPTSDKGAKSVFECYTIVANNQKEYYKTPNSSGNGNAAVNYDIESMKALVKNLQSSLSQATKVAQDLESALNKVNQNKSQNTNTTTTKNSGSSSTTTTTSTNSGSSSSTNTNSNSSNNSNNTSSSSTTTTSTNSGSSSSSSTGSTKNLKTDSDAPKLDPSIKKKLSDILNSFKIKSATVPVGRAAVYDDGRNRGLTPLTGTAHDTINNRQINSRAATVVSESVGGRNARDASRNDTRTEPKQIDSGRLAR